MEGGGRCARHGGRCAVPAGEVDIFVGGFPCTPRRASAIDLDSLSLSCIYYANSNVVQVFSEVTTISSIRSISYKCAVRSIFIPLRPTSPT